MGLIRLIIGALVIIALIGFVSLDTPKLKAAISQFASWVPPTPTTLDCADDFVLKVKKDNRTIYYTRSDFCYGE